MSFKRTLGIAGVGLASLLGGCPQDEATLNGANYRNPTFGITQQVCESTVQQQPIVFSYLFDHPIGNFDVKLDKDPENTEVKQPLQLIDGQSVRVIDTGDGGRKLEVTVYDTPDGEMERTWFSGEVTTVIGDVYDRNGSKMYPSFVPSVDRSGHTFQHHYFSIRADECGIPAIREQIDQLVEDFNNHVNTTIDQGAHSGNSNYNSNVNDNGNGLPPITESMWNGTEFQLYHGSHIINPNNDQNYFFVMNPASSETITGRLVISSSLDDALIARGVRPVFRSEDLGFVGVPNEFYTANDGPAYLISDSNGLRTYGFNFNVFQRDPASTQRVELIQGKVTYTGDIIGTKVYADAEQFKAQ